ncbi:transporter [Spirochaetia bacterium]|nr:transporter [Spirochaetia bacterium]
MKSWIFKGFGALLLTAGLIACAPKQAVVVNASDSPLLDSSGKEYYMITFLSGIEYWKGCFAGFEKAAALHGAKVVYTGSTDQNATSEVAVFEQVVAKNPAGIAVTCINPDSFTDAINAAVAKGIPVVTFDSDSPVSSRYTYLGTGNENAGAQAAAHMAEILGHKGEVAVVYLTGLLNQEQRSAGFKNYIETYEKNMKVVQMVDGGHDQTSSSTAAAAVLQANPNLAGFFATEASFGVGVANAVEESGKKGVVKVISFDTDDGTLEGIRNGSIAASIAQGTKQMGFWAFEMLYLTDKAVVIDDYSKGLAPLPANVDTGVSVVTKDNVEAF